MIPFLQTFYSRKSIKRPLLLIVFASALVVILVSYQRIIFKDENTKNSSNYYTNERIEGNYNNEDTLNDSGSIIIRNKTKNMNNDNFNNSGSNGNRNENDQLNDSYDTN